MIRLTNVSKSFDGGRTFAVNNVSLTIEKGETLVVLGSSGSGKSTILRMINRLLEPTSGCIELDGQNVEDYPIVQLRRSFGYVFQGIGLFPHMTVSENIAVVLRLLKQSIDAQRQRVNELLELVGLDPGIYATRYPAELSGGQQQRVGVARALAANPDYLLMDEPFGALDTVNRDELQQEILRLKKELNKTILFITHDIFEALRLCDRLAVMHHGELVQIGTGDELVHQPKNVFVRDLFQNAVRQVTSFAESLG
ncbi:MAG: glycine/betaine ABC transporter ATP-binding protein [Gammaproteobacteria bacterium RIFCSPHIGHO2_12_FULL_41_20]|nr:MAG: glycine/betaine ABC transporter ATP-binding protein [Gammaproteobacteria bacterium RIFCSPHIGHO2_12_FULL_41_20]